MIVIIEGPDGSGKSTLVHQMRTSSGEYCHVLSASGPPPGVNAILDSLEWLSKFPPTLFLICDRHRLISEPIYGSILRGASLVGISTPRIPASAVNAIVYCRPNLETIVENVRRTKADQLTGVWEHLGEIVEAYDEMMDHLQSSGMRVINYNYQVHNHRQLLKQLKEPTSEHGSTKANLR